MFHFKLYTHQKEMVMTSHKTLAKVDQLKLSRQALLQKKT